MADITRDFDFSGLPPNTPIRGADVDAELDKLYARINDMPAEAFQSAVADVLGLSQPGTNRRGKVIIPGEETRSGGAFNTLGTPDRVDDIVLPTDGLLLVSYYALWKNSVASAGAAALFIDGGAVQYGVEGGGFLSQVPGNSTPNVYVPLLVGANGIAGTAATTAYPSDPGTGFYKMTTPGGGGSNYGGGFALIYASAGSHDISVQFKASSGSVSAKERKLHVIALGF